MFAINTINYMVTVNIFFIETTTIIWLQLAYFLSRQLQFYGYSSHIFYRDNYNYMVTVTIFLSRQLQLYGYS